MLFWNVYVFKYTRINWCWWSFYFLWYRSQNLWSDFCFYQEIKLKYSHLVFVFWFFQQNRMRMHSNFYISFKSYFGYFRIKYEAQGNIRSLPFSSVYDYKWQIEMSIILEIDIDKIKLISNQLLSSPKKKMPPNKQIWPKIWDCEQHEQMAK